VSFAGHRIRTADLFIEPLRLNDPEVEVIYESGSLKKSAEKKSAPKKQKRAPVTAIGIVGLERDLSFLTLWFGLCGHGSCELFQPLLFAVL